MKPSLFAHPFASYCQKVLIALYENGTAFTYRKIGPEDPTAMSELTALWPLNKFPVLLDEGHTYLESSIIIEHLAIRHPGAVQLIPKDPETALETRMLDRFFDNYVMTPMQRIGDDFSLADCAAAPSLFFSDWVHEISAEFRHARAYRRRLLARPSVARAVDEARPYRNLFPPGTPNRD